MMFSFNTRLQAQKNTLPVIANLQLRDAFSKPGFHAVAVKTEQIFHEVESCKN